MPKAKSNSKKSKPFSRKEVRAIKEIVEDMPELKYHSTDAYSSGIPVSSTAIDVDLSAVPDADREGDRIEPSSINISGRVLRDASVSVGSADHVRVILVQWYPDTADDDCTFADILEGYNQTFAHMQVYVRDKTKRAKFNVLFDRVIHVSERTSGTGMLSYDKKYHIQRKLKKPIYFNPGATTGKNHIFLLAVGEQTSTAEDCQIPYQATLRYRDM